MSWVTGIDWSSVVPASVVTSTAVTLLLRYFDRNRPNLVLTRREVVLPKHLSGNRDLYGEPLTLENIGTAPAIDVRFVGSGCVVAVELKPSHGNALRHWESSVPSIAPGESVVLQMHHSNADSIIVVTHDRFPSIPWLRWWKKRLRCHVGRVPGENLWPASGYKAIRIPLWRQLIGRLERYELRNRTDEIEEPPEPLHPTPMTGR